MAKKKHRKKKHSGLWFFIGMLVYALVFLGAAGYGLNWLWGVMEEYEASRPYIAIDAYMEQLTKEHIVDACSDLIDQVDPNLQSEEECRRIMLDSLEGELTYARKASESTDTKQVFVIKCGGKVVGSFTIETDSTGEGDFRPWHFSSESFDMNDLMGTETVSITVPEGYPVSVNGHVLDESYITDTVTEEFEVLKDYYSDYDLPVFTVHTYQAGPFLGPTLPITAADAQGNPFVYDEATYDKEALIHNCDSETVEELDAFMEDFLEVYVLFAGCANDQRYSNYDKVIEYVVPESNLAKRMYDAVDGMQFAQSMGDEVDTIIINHFVQLKEGRYLCDVTYKVNTTGREGVVQTTSNAHIIVVNMGGKLLVESMISY